jgi:cytoskeletal protein CcmA (bactofilin family)
MWGNKKYDTPQAAGQEPTNFLTSKKSREPMRPLDATPELEMGWLGSSLQVKGEISGTDDLLVEGRVEGPIQLAGRKLTVGAEAKLTADIDAREVVVYGYVKGNVHATGKIEIKTGGSVHGNLITAQIMIEEGADFKGTFEIDRGTTKEADKNTSSRTAAAGAGAGPKSI